MTDWREMDDMPEEDVVVIVANNWGGLGLGSVERLKDGSMCWFQHLNGWTKMDLISSDAPRRKWTYPPPSPDWGVK